MEMKWLAQVINLYRQFAEEEEKFSYGNRAHFVRNLGDSSSHLVFSPTNKTFGELRLDLPDDAELLEATER